MNAMHCLKMVFAVGAGTWLMSAASEGQDTENPGDLLRALVPGEREVAAMNGLIDQLGADEFKAREAAMKALLAIPVLPPEVTKRALESNDPEIRTRIRKIVAGGSGERAAATFDRALQMVIEQEKKGLLPQIIRVLESGLPCRHPGDAERAAAMTAVEADQELVEKLAGSEERLLRRLAAGAAERTGELGGPVAARLLEDQDAAVRMRAAITLGNLGEISGARALGESLASEDTVDRVRAWKALRGLTGKNFEFQPLEPEKKREAALASWRGWLASDEVQLTGRAGEARWSRLFNGRDLTGWTQYRAGKAVDPKRADWKVVDGVLVCPGNGPGDLRSNEAFDAYVLVVEFRALEKRADSGIGVMLTAAKEKPNPLRGDGGDYLEIQLLPGHSGDLYAIGAFKAEVGGAKLGFSHPRHADVGDDPGMWHEARVEVAKGTAAIFIDGTEVNRAEGGPKEPGKILLREESYRFEFREISLLALEDAK